MRCFLTIIVLIVLLGACHATYHSLNRQLRRAKVVVSTSEPDEPLSWSDRHKFLEAVYEQWGTNSQEANDANNILAQEIKDFLLIYLSKFGSEVSEARPVPRVGKYAWTVFWKMWQRLKYEGIEFKDCAENELASDIGCRVAKYVRDHDQEPKNMRIHFYDPSDPMLSDDGVLVDIIEGLDKDPRGTMAVDIRLEEDDKKRKALARQQMQSKTEQIRAQIAANRAKKRAQEQAARAVTD